MPTPLRSRTQTATEPPPETGDADFWAPAIESFRKLVPQPGVMSEAEITAWADARMRASEEGAFFKASAFYADVAVRP